MSDNNDFKQFSEQYLQSCKEQISALANNPAMLEKALEPFMKMQQEYLNNADSGNLLTEDGENIDASKSTKSTKSTESTESDEDNVSLMLEKILNRVTAIRKKILPKIMGKVENIESRIVAIERHLGIVDSEVSSDDETNNTIEE